jgi:hypothetical protein
MPEVGYPEAINQVLHEEMERDNSLEVVYAPGRVSLI